MRVLYYIKTNLKTMVSSWIMTIGYFILFPIMLACFMATFQNLVHENPLKLKPIDIQIIDNDNSETSRKLVDLLESNDMKEIVSIVDKKPDAELIIESGYEDAVLSLKKGEIVVNKKVEDKEMAINTLKIILDNYHQSLYVTLSDGSLEELNKISSSAIIENIKIDEITTNNPYEKLAASMTGFVITMLIFTFVQGGYSQVSMNLDKRVNSTPITKLQYLLYDTAALLVYVFIIIFAYVMFFRITGISFRGNILDLILLTITSTILVVATAKSISTIFGAKYGVIIGAIVFTLPVLSAEMFMGEGNKISIITPTHYLNNAFSSYNLNGNLQGCGKWIVMILGISAVIYFAAVIKVSIKRRKKICV